eukprot:TRINITY_DN5571_c0_g1_i1.p1 TRINITY_DN5571_c0_g1~~TRINITY_DN5571_c0_g1_i1.p1  ORF type:complete len:554 (-),score=94.83 TRINITY_DN5571_c0_g1_i1:97-1758(-)
MRINALAVRTLFVSLLFLIGLNEKGNALPSEIPILNEFYTSLSGASWKNSSNWFSGPDPCVGAPWFGITCTPSGDNGELAILNIRMKNNNMVGTLPPSILYDMPTLRWLDLDRNNIEGAIPPASSSRIIGGGANFTILNLANNRVSGAWPEDFCRLPSIDTLYFYNNRITDISCVGLMTKLLYIDVGNNLLTGSFPSSILGLPLLDCIIFTDNRFEGPLQTTGWAARTTITRLFFANNVFNGSIPTELTTLMFHRLSFFDITNNRFSGSFPPNAPSNVRPNHVVSSFKTINNRLTGTIPSWVMNGVSLQALEFSGNSFVGPLPAITVANQYLFAIDVARNRLSGPLPDFSSLTALVTLIVEDNFFTGDIPTYLFFMPRMNQLKVSNNLFTGALPGALSDLVVFSGMCNSFTLPLPSWCGSTTNLKCAPQNCPPTTTTTSVTSRSTISSSAISLSSSSTTSMPSSTINSQITSSSSSSSLSQSTLSSVSSSSTLTLLSASSSSSIITPSSSSSSNSTSTSGFIFSSSSRLLPYGLSLMASVVCGTIITIPFLYV